MTLDDYLRSGRDTAKKLAARVGVTEVSISRIRNRNQRPSLALASRIVAETGGKVTFEELAA